MPSQHGPNRQPLTVRVDREILDAAKRRAVERGDTVTSVVERGLGDYLGRRFNLEHECEGNTFVAADLPLSAAVERADELRADPTVSAVRIVPRPAEAGP